MSVSVALQQINQADLPAKTKANAVALLEHVHEANGHACISWEELGDLFGVTSAAVVRRHLGYMHEVNLVRYSSNGDGLVYITFKAWTPASRVDARKEYKNSTKSARPRAKTVEKFYSSETDGDDEARVDARKEYKNSTETVEPTHSSYTRTRARSVSQLVSTSSTTHRELTDLQTATPPEQARSYALLTDPDVCLDARTAREFATDFGFEHLLRHVCVWRSELAAGKVRGPGALVNRIRQNLGGMITEADRASPLYRRHVPQEETQASEDEERRRKYDPQFWDRS